MNGSQQLASQGFGPKSGPHPWIRA